MATKKKAAAAKKAAKTEAPKESKRTTFTYQGQEYKDLTAIKDEHAGECYTAVHTITGIVLNFKKETIAAVMAEN